MWRKIGGWTFALVCTGIAYAVISHRVRSLPSTVENTIVVIEGAVEVATHLSSIPLWDYIIWAVVGAIIIFVALWLFFMVFMAICLIVDKIESTIKSRRRKSGEFVKLCVREALQDTIELSQQELQSLEEIKRELRLLREDIMSLDPHYWDKALERAKGGDGEAMP